MRVTLVLCQLQLYIITLRGFALPRRIINFSKGDSLHISVSSSTFPKVESGSWHSVVYQNIKNSTEAVPIIVNRINNSTLISKSLSVADNGTTLYLHLVSSVNNEVHYNGTVATLHYRDNRDGQEKDQCLSMCFININHWTKIAKPKVILSPSGELELSAGRALGVSCKTVHLPINTLIILYKEEIQYKNVTGNVIDTAIAIDEERAKITVYCSAHYNAEATKTVQSATLTVRVKAPEVVLVTEPELAPVTHYRVGDRFTCRCTSTTQNVLTTFMWVQRKDNETFDSRTSSSLIDIVLDESYNDTDIQCAAGYRVGRFHEKYLTTRLILRTTSEFVVPWYFILVIIIILLVPLAAAGYCCIKRKTNKNDCSVEVENDLYGAAPQYSVVYAEVYERRPRAPPPPPPAARAPYSNVIGFLRATESTARTGQTAAYQ